MNKRTALSEWVKSPRLQRAKTCRTCAHTEAAEAVAEVVQLIRNGATRMPLIQLRDKLAELFGYNLSASALRYHIDACLRLTWSKIECQATKRS